MDCRKRTTSKGVKGGLRTLTLCCLALLLCVVSLPLGGCQSAPTRNVESYCHIKVALADQPDIIYSDLSRYEQTGALLYSLHLCPRNRRLCDGYEVYSRDDNLKKAGSSSALLNIEVGCINIEHDAEVNERSARLPLVHYRTVEMEYAADDVTERENGVGSNHSYPEGSKVGVIGCVFSLDGYRYSILAGVLLTPATLEATTFEAEMSRANDEFFAIIDSILDQGGIPK